MSGGLALLARKANGDIRLDYHLGGIKRITVWERRGNAYLESTFREDGAVLSQDAVEAEKVEGRISEILADSGSAKPQGAQYKDVILEKACPWCSRHALVRYAEAYRSTGEVPVVPLYHCKECRGKSYYLTDEYLERLVSKNPDMFDQKDLERFVTSPAAFLTELKAHIISNFASKKVKRIV